MLDAVIDISHHNRITSFELIRNAGVIGVFQKATQGTKYVDRTFHNNRVEIHKAMLLFGAYHFGIGGDPAGQAEHLVETVGTDCPLVLDFESNPQGSSMTILEAEQFVHHVFTITGRYPGLYSGHTIKEALTKSAITKPEQTELSKCWLWIAQYGPAPLVPKVWSRWTFWQHTDGEVGPLPHTVDGIGHCDRDKFDGTELELRRFWADNSVKS